jgi:hypothetical protein
MRLSLKSKLVSCFSYYSVIKRTLMLGSGRCHPKTSLLRFYIKNSLSTYSFLSACLPLPVLSRWPSQVWRATVSEAQRSAANPARPLPRAAAAIPRRAKPILHRAQGALARATEQVLAQGCSCASHRCSPGPPSKSSPRGTLASSMRSGCVELRDSSKQQGDIAR